MSSNADAMGEEIARQRLAITDSSHALFSFLRELDLGQKAHLRTILNGIAQAGQPAAIAEYYCGVVTAYLDAMHGLCPFCQVNHNDELEAMLAEGQENPDV